MRIVRLLIPVLLAAAALVAAPAASAQPCWRTVVNDWYRNGRVDGHYPIHCYTEAIANLPEDSKQYSTAPEDIRRDMLLAMRGDQPSGPSGGSSSGPTSGPNGSDNSGGNGGSSTSSETAVGFGVAPATTSAAGTSTTTKDTGFLPSVLNTFGPKNASSVPLPLIILAAVALLLLAAGGVSFAARRIQARRIPPPQG
jgi:hypothetical protein